MIVIDPNAFRPRWSYDMAMLAVVSLRAKGYSAYVGLPGESEGTHIDVAADDWNDAVSTVIAEIGKTMRHNERTS